MAPTSAASVVQAQAEVGREGGALSPALSGRIQAKRGGGQPLDATVRRGMEGVFQVSFGHVRIHADSEADVLNRGVAAIAFTVGSDIFFRAGAYQPHSTAGQHLLAHELTHVVQQRTGSLGTSSGNTGGGTMTVGAADDRHEQEAEATAHRVTTALQAHATSAGAGIARRHDPDVALAPSASGVARVAAPAAPAPAAAPRFVLRNPPLAFVFSDIGANLHVSEPHPTTKDAPLPPGPRLPSRSKLRILHYQQGSAWAEAQVLACPPGQAGFVGKTGWVNVGLLDTDWPDPEATMYPIKKGDTAETIVKKAGYRIAPGRDARYYVNVLVYVNKPHTLYNPDPHPEQTDHWTKTVAVTDETIWLPGQAFADSLTGVVGSGSITGGAWATLQQELGWAQVVVQHTISVLSQPVALVADAATNAAHYALTVGGRVIGQFVGAAAHEAAALVGGTMRAINAATSNPAAMLHALVGLATAPARLLTSIPGAFVGLLQEQGKALLGSLLGTQVRDELGATIGAILKDPLTFARNLATAVGVGFHGLLTHLGSGTNFVSDALGWLAGRSGITIPTGVGLGELVLIVAQQVVGLSEAHLTDLLVKALVKRGTSEPQARTMVQRAEGVIGTLGTALTHLPHSAGEARQLVTQALGTLGATVRDAVQGWLLQKVVTAAIAKLVALCSPGVGLVLQAVQAIYGAIQTFLQYKEQLGALLGRLMGTFKGLATPSSGAVTAAGGAITGVLVGMIPAALNFIADFFGLGGLAAKVQGVIGAIRAKIDTMVSAIINRLVGLVQGIAGRIGGGAHGPATGTPASGHAPPAPAHQENPKHEAIAQAIVTKLEHIDGAPKDFAATRTEKEGEAGPLKARYQPQLEKGINLSITFATEPDDAGGKETLDFTVVIAPNTTTKSGRIPVEKIDPSVDDVQAGTRAHPFPIIWPKPASKDYPVLYLGGPNTSIIRQADLRQKVGQTDATGHVIKEYKPEVGGVLPDGTSIGLAPQWQMRIGTVIGPLSNAGTPGGKKILKVLEQFGFNSTIERMDGDHVHEIQMGGKDEIPNLWPLTLSTNRGAGSIISRIVVHYPSRKTTTVRELKNTCGQRDYFFKAVDFQP